MMMFPTLIPDDVVKRMPPMIFSTREFDLYRRDTEEMAAILKKNGRLLMEPYVQPGTTHMSGGYPGFAPTVEFEEATVKIYKHFAAKLFPGDAK